MTGRAAVFLFAVLKKKCSGWIKMKRRGKKPEDRKETYNKGTGRKTWKGSEMRMRRQMSEGRPGGNVRKGKRII